MNKGRPRLHTTVDPSTLEDIRRLAKEWRLPMGRVLDRVFQEKAAPDKRNEKCSTY